MTGCTAKVADCKETYTLTTSHNHGMGQWFPCNGAKRRRFLLGPIMLWQPHDWGDSIPSMMWHPQHSRDSVHSGYVSLMSRFAAQLGGSPPIRLPENSRRRRWRRSVEPAPGGGERSGLQLTSGQRLLGVTGGFGSIFGPSESGIWGANYYLEALLGC